MTKLDRLNTFMTERLMAAVQEIVLSVGRTVREYEEETERVRTENERLREMLRDLGCTNPDLQQSDQPVSPEQPKWTSSKNEAPESLEEVQQNHLQKQNEQHPSIKTEKLEYPVDDQPESAALMSKAINHEVSQMPVDHSDANHASDEMINCQFPTEIKIELINSSVCLGDVREITKDAYQSWSQQSPDLHLETGAQNLNQLIYTTNEASPTVSQQSNKTRNAHHVSNHTILCTNRSYCRSKCCEMQKRTIAKSSPVWKYFSLKKGDCSKAVCLMCKAVISRGRKEYTTSALLKHLRMKHGKC